ncbi:MAG: HEAT repeat domain-containing protein, partial [Anaerolineae bacterium]
EALRAALSQGGPVTWRIGLIQSLGERGDARAVKLIGIQLGSEEATPAAASALGKIADPRAVSALWGAYEKGLAIAADGLVTAGNRLLAAGDKAAAKDLFQRLYLAGVASAGAEATEANGPLAPVQTRSAALIGWATADPGSARDSIVNALQQQEPRLQLAAVTAAAVAFGKDRVSAALAPLWPKLSPTAKIYVLQALDASAEKEVIAAATEAEEQVQLAALERLGEIGSAASIPVLFQAATAGSSNARKAAEGSLARITGPGADRAIAELAGEGKAKGRVVAINALAQRYEKSALPALLEYAGDADPAVSAAACAALARLGTDQESDGLIELVRSGKAPGAVGALRAVAGRAGDKSTVARKLITQTQTCEPQQLAPLFDVLAMLGGKEALLAVATAAAGSNEATKDAAIRALANWPEFPATRVLLVVAADPNTTRIHNVLAIQGIARLVKAADREPAAARLEAVSAAMKAAKRDEEKKLLLSALASVSDRQAAEAIKPFLGDPRLGQEAGLAALNLAETLRKGDKPAAKDLARAVRSANLSEGLNRKADAFLGKD